MFANSFKKELKVFLWMYFPKLQSKERLWQQVLASLCETCKIYMLEINCYGRIAKYLLPIISRISENF